MSTLGYFAVSFAIVVGSIGPVIAIGKIGSQSLISMSKNPEAADKLQTAMIMAIAFAEAVAIYCLVIALVIKFTWFGVKERVWPVGKVVILSNTWNIKA